MKSLLNLFKKKKKDKWIAVVSGLPRSGTSMMMKMLEAGGIPLLSDGQRTADEDNPKGYYEFERVKKLRDGDIAWLPEAQGKVVKIISALLSYLPDTYEYRLVFMERNIQEILVSQKKMLIRRGEDPDKVDDKEMQMLFQKHLQQVDDWIRSKKNITCLKVNYNSVLADPTQYVATLNTFFGNSLNAEKMTTVIDPILYRSGRIK